MPRGPRRFRVLIEKEGLTRVGGLSVCHLFCNALGLRRFLQTDVRWPRYAPRASHPADLFLTHVVAIVAGIGRIEHTQSLGYHGVIPPLLGRRNAFFS